MARLKKSYFETESSPFLPNSQKGGLSRAFLWAFSFVFWVGLWWALAALVGKEVLLPGPWAVVKRLFQLAAGGEFWLAAGGSILRIALGFLLAVAAGSSIALLTAFSRFFHWMFAPILQIIKATPVASFIVLALVWLTKARVPTFIAFLMVLPVVWANVSAGLRSADPQLVEMAHTFGFSRFKTLLNVYFPSALPYFRSACATGAGLAWKAGIAAEVLSRTPGSIGAAVYDSKIYLETVDLFAWTAVLIVLSVLFEKLIVLWVHRASSRLGGIEHADQRA